MTDAPPPPPTDPGQGDPNAGGQQQHPPGSYGNPGQPYGGGYQPQPMRPEDEKLWATLIHVGGIPFGFIPSLIGYLVLRERGPFIKEHTRVALNFQLTMLIGYVLGTVLIAVVIGGFVILAVGIVIIVFSIIAAIAANQGRYYRYPLSIEFIKN